ncbi:MAG: hypothetical protein AAGF67_01945 [Verrucomicrobiota bacterium]
MSEEDCPEAVAKVARKFAGKGRIERILKSRRKRRAAFHVEIALNNRLERSLQISEDGKLLSQVDRIRESELPVTVKNAVTGFLEEGARFDGADFVRTSESEEFHVELDLGDDLDLHLFLDEDGALLRQHEVGDF